MALRTYEVQVQATALRTIKVRARSGREALEQAQERINVHAGPWLLDFPGSEDEHYDVYLDGDRLGPTGYEGTMTDDEPEEG